MPKKQQKPKVVVLDSGEKIIQNPPDDQHPDGKKILIKESSPMRDKLNGLLEDHKAQHAEIHQGNRDRLVAKQEKQAAYPAVPPEKRPV